MELVDTIKIGEDVVKIWQVEHNDYVVDYETHGKFKRGTILEVMQDLHAVYGVFDMEIISRGHEPLQIRRG